MKNSPSNNMDFIQKLKLFFEAEEESLFSTQVSKKTTEHQKPQSAKVKPIQQLVDEFDMNMVEGKTLKADIPSGISAFDQLVGGFRKGNITVFGGIPGMGRTTLLTQIAINVGYHSNVLYVSPRINSNRFTRKALLDMTQTLGALASLGNLNPSEIQEIENAKDVLAGHRIWHMNDVPSAPKEIHAALSDVINKNQIELVIIDTYDDLVCPYLSEFTSDIKEQLNFALNKMAVEHNVAIVVACDLSDEAHYRTDNQRPITSDFKDNFSLVRISETVAAMYRPTYYNITLTENFPAINSMELEIMRSPGKIGAITI